MRRLVIGLVALGLVAGSARGAPPTPAAPAPPNDTIAAILAHGDVVNASGRFFVFAYKPDGTFTAGALSGTYTVDGGKLCITIDGVVDNDCADYPAGKKTGDSFTVDSEMGPFTVTIR